MLKRLGTWLGPPPDNQGAFVGFSSVQLEEYDSDLLGTERPTRMPPDSGEFRREASARGSHGTASARGLLAGS
jgi:hypothetical protein